MRAEAAQLFAAYKGPREGESGKTPKAKERPDWIRKTRRNAGK